VTKTDRRRRQSNALLIIRAAAVLCVWGCWFFGLWHVLS